MDVVRHQTKRMNPVTKPGNTFLKKQKKMTAVSVRNKNILTAVAAKHDMVNAARKVNAWFACHDAKR